MFGVKVLPVRRVISSKKAANRLKDQAVLPALKAALAAIKSSKLPNYDPRLGLPGKREPRFVPK
ncbi:MAG TPA: hypothetical protein VH853_14415 [Polyangia bacterium]|nr:hypothetical protein [Polyangia bacterium]